MDTLLIAGYARSGLTLTMQLLHYGGYPCYGTPPAFEDYGRINQIDYGEAEGKAVKIPDIYNHFPPKGDYRVIRLRRNYQEQAKSVIKFMRVIVGQRVYDNRKTRREIIRSLKKEYHIIDRWAKKQTALMILDFEDIINDPELTLEILSDFINFKLDRKALKCVIKRNTECYNGFIEAQILNRKL